MPRAVIRIGMAPRPGGRLSTNAADTAEAASRPISGKDPAVVLARAAGRGFSPRCSVLNSQLASILLECACAGIAEERRVYFRRVAERAEQKSVRPNYSRAMKENTAPRAEGWMIRDRAGRGSQRSEKQQIEISRGVRPGNMLSFPPAAVQQPRAESCRKSATDPQSGLRSLRRCPFILRDSPACS